MLTEIVWAIVLLSLIYNKETVATLETELQLSMEKAMQCSHRDPPTEPVMAMTPARFSQLVALMRRNLDTPACDSRLTHLRFQLENKDTWNFCVFGTCIENHCQCLRTYTGPTCATYIKKCWLMYCFLTGCHPSHQTIYCKCDSLLYGKQVLTGDYWYDDGKKNVYYPPPIGWRDDVSNAHKATTSKQEKGDKSERKLIPLSKLRSDLQPELPSFGMQVKTDQNSKSQNRNFYNKKDHLFNKEKNKSQVSKTHAKTKGAIPENSDQKTETSKIDSSKDNDDVKEVLEEVEQVTSATTSIKYSYITFSSVVLNIFVFN